MSAQSEDKSRVRLALRPAWRYAKRSWHALQAPFRKLPEFLICGEVKCGTFAMYHYLSQHPRVIMCPDKEPHFFNTVFRYGLPWYKSHFPWIWTSYRSGEATADYFFHPRSAPRISQILPDVRCILLFRNPVERAFSHYRHNLKKKPWMKHSRTEGVSETLSFEEALHAEEERLAGERERLINEPDYYSWNHEHYSYKARGRYVEQLEHWYKHIDPAQCLVLQSEALRADKQAVFERVCTFLELPPAPLEDDRDYHVTEVKRTMDSKTRELLAAYFEPYNERLYSLIGERWDW
jgi:hypothetical protein